MGRTATHERMGGGDTTEHKISTKVKKQLNSPSKSSATETRLAPDQLKLQDEGHKRGIKEFASLITISNSFMYILPEHLFAQYLKIVYKLQNGLFPFQPDVIYLVKALDERQEKALFSLHFYIAT